MVLVAPGLAGAFGTAGVEVSGAFVAGIADFVAGTADFVAWKSFTLIVSESYVNPAEVKRRKPPVSFTNEVATLLVPSAAIIEIVALIAAFVNP
jgi:hypothetical protein